MIEIVDKLLYRIFFARRIQDASELKNRAAIIVRSLLDRLKAIDEENTAERHKVAFMLHDAAEVLAVMIAVTEGSFFRTISFGRIIRQHHTNRMTSNILKPPGLWLFIAAEFVLSKRTFNLIAVPSISDMREEYFESLSQHRNWKARWVRVRGTWSFFAALGLDRAFSLVSLCTKIWKNVN